MGRRHERNQVSCRGLSLMSGGLDSQLAIRVLQRAGAEVEAVCFSTPFFDISAAKTAADALGVKLHIVDFTDDEISLIENPPHGFGGAMNPCIDCHALMIKRAGELMTELGYDFVATGEVQGQRPMSQNKQSMGIVEKCSGLKGRLVRPMSAKLLEPTIPELEGKLDREKLLDISGRSRDRQIALAAAEARADAEIKALQHKADEKATVDAQVLASNTRNRKAAMKARAERKMDEAVSKVVERIVKG